MKKIIIALISFQLIGCAPTPNIIIDPPELEQPKTKIITIGMGVIGIIVISSCIINWIKAKDAEIAELKELNQKHDNELKESNQKHDNELKESNQKHDNELKESNQKHDNELKELNQKHDNELKESNQKHDNELKESNQKHDNELKELNQKHDNELKESNQKHDNELKELNQKHDNELKRLSEWEQKKYNELSAEKEKIEKEKTETQLIIQEVIQEANTAGILYNMGELESGNLARQVKEMHKIINSIIKLEFEQLQNEKETIQGLIPGILKNAEKYNIAHSIESIPPNDLATQVLEIWKLQHNIGYNLGLKDGANDGISHIITMAIREPEKFQQMLSQTRRQLEST